MTHVTSKSKDYTLTLAALRKSTEEIKDFTDRIGQAAAKTLAAATPASAASTPVSPMTPELFVPSVSSLGDISELTLNLTELCGHHSDGLIDRAWKHFELERAKAPHPLPEITKEEAFRDYKSLDLRYKSNSFKIQQINAFFSIIHTPSSPITEEVKAFALDCLESTQKKLYKLCGDACNGTIDAAWKRYEKEGTRESHAEYQALDAQRVQLKDLEAFFECLLAAETSESFVVPESAVSFLSEIAELKQSLIDHNTQLSGHCWDGEIDKAWKIYSAISALEEYKGLDERRKQIEEKIHRAHELIGRVSAAPSTESTSKEDVKEKALSPPIAPPRSIDGIAAARDLIAFYDSCWSTETKSYQGKGLSTDYNFDRFKSVLDINNAIFAPGFDPSSHYGFIEKKVVEPSSQIFVRADLHGDLRSLLENLKALQAEGLLNENFQCAPNTHLVFLGDYTDRGIYSLQVLELLFSLRMENPNHVTLIRGNHESLMLNDMYGGADRNFCQALSNPDIRKSLEEAYNTVSLTTYIGQKSGSGNIQYTAFTHGLFELHVDPQEILSSEDKHKMLAPKISHAHAALSKRIESSDQIRKKLKFTQSYNIINLLNAKSQKQRNLNNESELSAYSWGDMDDRSLLESLGARRWKLSALDVYRYLKVISTPRAKVKLIFRGHEHAKQHHIAKITKGSKETVKKIVVTTLPIGMDGNPDYIRYFEGQPDTGYIITTQDKVKDWRKRAMLRASCSDKTMLTVWKNIFSPEI